MAVPIERTVLDILALRLQLTSQSSDTPTAADRDRTL